MHLGSLAEFPSNLARLAALLAAAPARRVLVRCDTSPVSACAAACPRLPCFVLGCSGLFAGQEPRSSRGTGATGVVLAVSLVQRRPSPPGLACRPRLDLAASRPTSILHPPRQDTNPPGPATSALGFRGPQAEPPPAPPRLSLASFAAARPPCFATAAAGPRPAPSPPRPARRIWGSRWQRGSPRRICPSGSGGPPAHAQRDAIRPAATLRHAPGAGAAWCWCRLRHAPGATT